MDHRAPAALTQAALPEVLDDPIVVSGALARVRERAAGRGVQVRAYPEVRMIEYSLWTRPNSVRAWSNRSQLRMSDNL